MMIVLGLYYLIGIGSVIFSLCNKNKPKEWLYYLFLVLYGGFGVHQFYAKNLPRAVVRLTAGFINLPFFLLFINGLFRVLADGYDDPAYGLIILGALGGILPASLILILFVLDLEGMKLIKKVEDGENQIKGTESNEKNHNV
ncbi:hypothetical protein [Treponema saccharophilum]|uniref:Uncharacterized protein n=1 Tax=Treponema saccharophilum DSM 2985 TaxID=907348 RepID=H7EPT9_9SPIR|nr:hypothetical protein [Treponema saccharophilum]EIC00490.1 hypothetical protein TresaDRAFT_0584 [Treponema saccharophilum DSM 2985]BDC95025.1 hypothetical protein TRSA_01240 [Treponema saccharophilum]